MNIKHRWLAVACAALTGFAATPAIAGRFDFQCVIVDHQSAGDDGRVERPPRPYLVGERFAIDRKTGQLVGPEHALWSTPRTKFRILSTGGKSYFVVIGVEPGREGTAHITYVQVQDFGTGEVKPFIVIQGREVASGVCK